MRSCGICKGELLNQKANLCVSCADKLQKPIGFCVEQLLSTALNPTNSAVVDSWGRVHFLEAMMPIGRRPISRGLAILESSVSRNHAEIMRDASGTWSIRDVGSRNGTFVQGAAIASVTKLSGICPIRLGGIGLYFVQDTIRLLTNGVIASTVTIRPEDRVAMEAAALQEENEDVFEEDTFAGFPKLPVRMFEQSLSGGGHIEIGGARMQLTIAQYELLGALIDGMKNDIGQLIEVRGFMPSSILISKISWDSPYPAENHLKQLIRRVRRILKEAGLGNMIESKRGFGYRLRCIPVSA